VTGRVFLVMGVSGAGKTTVGAALAARLGAPFLDADDLHPAENRAKMAAGVALNDADRAPWLDAVAEVIGGWAAAGTGGVVACSALRRRYRDRLRRADPGLVTVFLELDEAALAARLAARRGHYFAPSLLGSQLALLEPPGADEPAIRVDGGLDVEAVVAGVLAAQP
jgi:gluconokinase